VKALRSLVLALAVTAIAPAVWAPSVAQAAEPFAGDPLVVVLPSTPVPTGQTRELHVLALTAEGEPMEGLSLEATVVAGSADDLREVGDGLYVLPFTAPAEPGSVELQLAGKTPGRDPVKLFHVVEVVESHRWLEARSDPESLVLGQVATATLKVGGVGSDGVLVRTNSGTVGKPVRLNTSYTAQLTPPKVNFPQVALVTWVDAADPSAVGWQAVPLSGSVAFPVKGPAGASVLLEVAGREFGPSQLGDDGKGKVKIEVPPGVNEATQLVVEDGETTESDLPLGIPATKRLGLFPVSAAIPSDPAVSVPLRVVVVTAEGEPDDAAEPSFTVSRGTVGPPERIAPGVYEAELSPPSEPGSITVGVSLGDDDVQSDELTVDVVRGLPEALAMNVQGDGAERTVTVTGAQGSLQVDGASVGEPIDDGEGRTWTLTDVSEPLSVRAVAPSALSPNPVRHVVVLADRAKADPAEAVGAWVITVDAFGLPVPGVEVSLAGDGLQAPASVTTGDEGRARVQLTAGDEGLASLMATAGAAEGVASLVIGEGVANLTGLRGRGPHAARWAATHPVHTAGEAGTAEPDRIMRPGRQFVQIEADREVTAGATVSVVIRVLDSSGEPVDSEPPDMTTTAGLLGDVVRDGPGVWRVDLTLPDSEQEVVVEATSAEGTTESLAVMDSPWAAPAPPGADGDEVDVPWLRVRGSAMVSSYRYQQVPSADPGSLLPSTLTVGGDGGAAASPAGFEGDARVWLDEVGVPYLGFHSRIRSGWYAVEAEIFDTPARDSLLSVGFDVVGRYPFDTAGDRFWVGAKAGVAYDDFVLFEGCLEPDCTLEYSTLGVPSLTLGPELGAEVGRLFLVGGYGFGLANFAQPYRHAVEVDLGVHLVDAVFLDVGFSSVSRRVDLLGADSGVRRGEVNDSQMIGTFGVGLAL